MKICFFNSAKVWGGGEKWHLENAVALAETGNEVVVVSNKESELLKRAKEKGLVTKSFKISNLSFFNPLKRQHILNFFNHEKFNVLIMNFSKDLKIAAPMAKKAGINRIIYRRGSAIPIRDTSINRYLYSKCITDILANSEATKKTINQINPNLFPENRIKVIYNGIKISENKNLEKTNNPIPVIGNLGRLVHQKGQDILIDIANRLKHESVKCKFIIGGDGPLSEKLKEKVDKLGLSNYVFFEGFVTDPIKFLNKTDIFILTSRWEGFGYVLAEAMSVKKPIVAFKVDSVAELIKNNFNGYAIPYKDERAFADAIKKLIESPVLREKMGTNGYEYANKNFNFDDTKQKVINYILNN